MNIQNPAWFEGLKSKIEGFRVLTILRERGLLHVMDVGFRKQACYGVTNASSPHQDAFEAQTVSFDFRDQRPQDELKNECWTIKT